MQIVVIKGSPLSLLYGSKLVFIFHMKKNLLHQISQNIKNGFRHAFFSLQQKKKKKKKDGLIIKILKGAKPRLRFHEFCDNYTSLTFTKLNLLYNKYGLRTEVLLNIFAQLICHNCDPNNRREVIQI